MCTPFVGVAIRNSDLSADRGQVQLGRIGEPEDVANTVLFLASDESKYTTGAEFVIDGGGSAGIIVGE